VDASGIRSRRVPLKIDVLALLCVGRHIQEGKRSAGQGLRQAPQRCWAVSITKNSGCAPMPITRFGH
jgi:hypothetical protein